MRISAEKLPLFIGIKKEVNATMKRLYPKAPKPKSCIYGRSGGDCEQCNNCGKYNMEPRSK